MQKKLTRDAFDKLLSFLTKEEIDGLWAIYADYDPPTNTSLDIVDYSSECSMCGKPMPYRFCGMCPSCEMVWNS